MALDLSKAAILAALTKIQGVGGYSDEPTSARVRELSAWAEVVSQTLTTLRDALDQVFPDTLDTLLDETEEALRLGDDWRLTTEARRSRIRTLRAILGGSQAELVAALSAELGAIVTPNTRTAIESAGCEPERIFWQAVQLDGADFGDQGIRQRALELVRRLLPARSIPRDPDELASVITDNDAFPRWGTVGAFDSSRIGTGTPLFSTGRPPARLVDYSIGRRLDSVDINAIQSGGLVRAIASTAAALGTPGGRWLVFALDIANGVTATIDTAQDWRNRYVYTSVRSFGTNDYRPGQAGDINANASPSYGGVGYSLSGVAWSMAAFPGGIAGLNMLADAVGLKIQNATGATWRGLVFVWSTGPVKGGSSAAGTSALSTYKAGDAPPTATWAANLRDATWIFRPNGGAAQVQTWPSYAGDGGLRRFGFLVDVSRPSSGSRQVVIDASTDWRDRLILVEAAVTLDTYGAWPGSADSTFANGDAFPVIMYTGPGEASGAVAGLYSLGLTVSQPIYLYADVDTGALCAEVYYSGSPAWQVQSFALRLHASEQLGKRVTSPPTVLTVAPVADAVIEPTHLNALQDAALVAQFGGARRSDRLTNDVPRLGPPPLRSATFPIGPIAHGQPRVPLEWLVADRYGTGPETYYQKRQNVVGSVLIPIACELASGTWTTTPDGLRMVDRLVSLYGAISSLDLRPGQVQENALNAGNGNAWTLFFYTGGIVDPPVERTASALTAGTAVKARLGTDGRLQLRQDSGGPAWIVALIEASMPIGAHSTY